MAYSDKDTGNIQQPGQLPPHLKEKLKGAGVFQRNDEEETQENKQNTPEVNAALIQQLFNICRQIMQLIKSQEEDIQQIKTVLREATEEGEAENDNK